MAVPHLVLFFIGRKRKKRRKEEENQNGKDWREKQSAHRSIYCSLPPHGVTMVLLTILKKLKLKEKEMRILILYAITPEAVRM